MTDRLRDEQMLGPFFKEYADLGHWFNFAHDKCINCGTPTIDLYEDGSYGPIRSCASGIEAATAGETPKSGSTEGESPTTEGGDAQ